MPKSIHFFVSLQVFVVSSSYAAAPPDFYCVGYTAGSNSTTLFLLSKEESQLLVFHHYALSIIINTAISCACIASPTYRHVLQQQLCAGEKM